MGCHCGHHAAKVRGNEPIGPNDGGAVRARLRKSHNQYSTSFGAFPSNSPAAVIYRARIAAWSNRVIAETFLDAIHGVESKYANRPTSMRSTVSTPLSSPGLRPKTAGRHHHEGQSSCFEDSSELSTSEAFVAGYCRRLAEYRVRRYDIVRAFCMRVDVLNRQNRSSSSRRSSSNDNKSAVSLLLQQQQQQLIPAPLSIENLFALDTAKLAKFAASMLTGSSTTTQMDDQERLLATAISMQADKGHSPASEELLKSPTIPSSFNPTTKNTRSLLPKRRRTCTAFISLLTHYIFMTTDTENTCGDDVVIVPSEYEYVRLIGEARLHVFNVESAANHQQEQK